jgi:multimeric flavodoxin WrbA
VEDIMWADALAFGINCHGSLLHFEIKHWLDALGFNGWRHLRDKVGCVFATQGQGNEKAEACRMVARLFRSRGMETVTPAELGVSEPPHDDDGTAIGQTFAQWCNRLETAAPQAHSHPIG